MSKYKAKPTIIAGIRFASKKEGARYLELRLLEKAGEISDLKLQPAIRCVVNGSIVCTYKADFFYIERKTFKEVYEDVKGMRLALYVLKAKLVKACTGIEIKET